MADDKKGRCPICGRVLLTSAEGRMRPHISQSDVPFTVVRCNGVGLVPVPLVMGWPSGKMIELAPPVAE